MKKMIRTRALALPALSVLSMAVAVSVQAQSFEVNPVVVSATRMEQPLADVLSSVSVITRADIDKSQAASLADLLQGEAGFEFGRNGGPGATTSFFLRGEESKSVVVLIDGVRSQTDGNGSLTLTDIPLAQVERIEVLRGNAGALYGESAIGGVINVVTRSGKGEPHAYGAMRIGSNKTEGLDVGYGGRNRDTSFDVNMGYSGAAGFAAMDTLKNANVNPDRDGYRNRFASAKVEQKIDSSTKLGLRLNTKEALTDYDNGAFTEVNTDVHQFKIKTDAASLYASKAMTDLWFANLDLTSSNFQYETVKNGTISETGYYHGHQDVLRFNNTYQLVDSTKLNFGVDASKETYGQRSTYDMTRKLMGYYLGTTSQLGNWTLQGNARHDSLDMDRAASGISNNKIYESDSYLMGLGYKLNDQWKLTSSTSTGFRAPSAAELYGWGGNANLKPETHRSDEVGVVYSSTSSLIRLVHFQSRTKDAIGYDANWVNANVGEVHNSGYELTTRSQLMGNTIKASFVTQDPWNVTDNYLPGRRAKKYGSIDISRWVNAHEVGMKVFASGKRADFNMQDSPMLHGYATVAFYLSRKIDADWTGRIKLENAFNRHYELAGGYNTPGRGIYATLQYQPK